MTTFGLVHGAWHGAWCWAHLEPELERLGHRVVTVELPCEDPGETFATYADRVVAAFSGEEDLVLVGHSLAGLTIPIAATKLPVDRLMFVCAVLAAPGLSFADQLKREQDMLAPGRAAGLSEPDDLGRRSWVDFDVAWNTLFGDCDEASARWAYDQLRPQALAPYDEPCPLDSLPAVECSYIACSDDRLVNPGWSIRAARERLGVEATVLPGSHSPFLSRPAELARLMTALSPQG